MINKIILHCSATKAGQPFTVEDITRWHIQRGFRTIGYHFVIYLDGTVHKGRDISEIGAHVTGQNSNSIGVCYIGGLDASGKASDTRTPEQKEAICDLVAKLKIQFPNSTIHGHCEFANKACPCFDVKKEFGV
ncbi:N-acetylmuramoyl-L-alanine amidase [Parabacteroides sp. OttesenSCG-928-B22]|nr:N-acetylmuramoyl-L-alanine amidase [Parabacteroides sp. OttesenSCG-928-B22]